MRKVITIVPDDQVSRQLDAMRTEKFELLLLQFGETTEGSLITTTAAGILKRIKWLKAKNAHGYNINIRPAASRYGGQRIRAVCDRRDLSIQLPGVA